MINSVCVSVLLHDLKKLGPSFFTPSKSLNELLPLIFCLFALLPPYPHFGFFWEKL